MAGPIAASTGRIHVGAGGVLLNNHAPLVIAERFGTLETVHPGRIDLGIGRGPGGWTLAAASVRSEREPNASTFDEQLAGLAGRARHSGPGPAH